MVATPETKKPKVEVAKDASMPKQPVQDLMRSYYSKLFPHQHMYKWLVYGNDGKHPQADASFFMRREFCFTLDGDIFVRYQSFKDATDMATAISNKCPAKIDIGPVYTCNPQERLKFGTAFQPTERELVFDIDLTDYDDVRTCGKEGHICNKCWPLMAVAVKIIDRGLREDFGFRNILWVYSGRRGIHCWVCDSSARKLSDDQRAAIANYFAVYKGHENDKPKIVMGAAGMHPSVQKSTEILECAWRKELLPEQRLLEDEGMQETMLRFLPTDELVSEVRKKWDRMSSASSKTDINIARWDALVAAVESKTEVERYNASNKKGGVSSGGPKLLHRLQKVVHEIILAFSYPRLDMEVSKKMNHLLKAPFCVHPKTGKVCVPIDPAAAFAFDPDNVPTVHSLLDELRQAKAEERERASSGAAQEEAAAADSATGAGAGSGSRKGEEWSQTAMAQYVELFESAFLDSCLAANRAEFASKARAATVANAATDFSF